MGDLPEQNVGGAEYTPPHGDPMSGGKPQKGKAGEKAEKVRERGHEYAETARQGADKFSETAEKATNYAEKAKHFVSDLESRLDGYIDQAEKLLEKGTQYTSTAKSFLNDHPEYKERFEQVLAKAGEMRSSLQNKKAESGDVKQSAKQKAEAWRAKGKDLLHEGQERYEEIKHRGASELSHSVGSSVRQAGSYVRTHPVDTLLLGAATGIIFGTILKNVLTGREPDYALPPGPGPDVITGDDMGYSEDVYVSPDDIQ